MSLICLILICFSPFVSASENQFDPTWESLDSRPIPSWFDQSKFGVFMHFGVFSVPSIYDAWFVWYWKNATDPTVVKFMKDNYKPNFTYADFASMLTAEFFNTTRFAATVQQSGANWFDESKFGVFMHFGVFSVPSVISEWFVWYWKNSSDPQAVQFMRDNYKPNFTYADFAPLLTTELFNATKFADTVRKSGANPDWESIDSRPIPKWFDEAKFGVFAVFGVYSVPGVISEWFPWYWLNASDPIATQFMKDNFKPNFTYAQFAPMLTTELFNATNYANLVKRAGGRYFVFTSKHCEGYCNWPSKFAWNWNSKDVGPNRDIVGELKAAFTKTAPEVKFGLYFAHLEWFHPLYMDDKSNNYNSYSFPQSVTLPQLKELISTYQPDLLWSDAGTTYNMNSVPFRIVMFLAWEAPDTYWNSTLFLAWLYNQSPVKDKIVTNDRWGIGAPCNHGGYYTCEDKYNPKVLQKHKWENAMTVDRYSWGIRRTMTIADVLSIEEIIETFAQTISCGGNLLLNVGPTHDGRIIPIFEERLMQMGDWLKVNGEAVYASKPWIYQNDSACGDVWYTSKLQDDTDMDPNRIFNPQVEENTIVYGILITWPRSDKLVLRSPKPTESTTVQMLGYNKKIDFYTNPFGSITIDTRLIDWHNLPSLSAWVFKFTRLQNDGRDPFQREETNDYETFV